VRRIGIVTDVVSSGVYRMDNYTRFITVLLWVAFILAFLLGMSIGALVTRSIL
jgi:hypothetical protein